MTMSGSSFALETVSIPMGIGPTVPLKLVTGRPLVKTGQLSQGKWV